MSRNIVKPLIVGAILVAIFVALRLILPPLLEPETGQWVAFFTALVAILSGYICFIAFMSRLLSGRISERLFGILEKLLIAGILLGIVSAGFHCPVRRDLDLYPVGLCDTQECSRHRVERATRLAEGLPGGRTRAVSASSVAAAVCQVASDARVQPAKLALKVNTMHRL
jgi:hypothetical protein